MGGQQAPGGAAASSWRQPRFEPTLPSWRDGAGRPAARREAGGAGGAARTDLAWAFGAEVAVDAPPRGLYLVVGHRGAPAGSVRSVGGEVVVVLEERNSLLAILDVDCHPALQRQPDVALAGPVTIDPTRFARFVALAGLDQQVSPAPPPRTKPRKEVRCRA